MKQRQFLDVVDESVAHERFDAATAHLVPRLEKVLLDQAAGRVLGENVVAAVDVPGFDRSNMDGFAVRATDTHGAEELEPIALALAFYGAFLILAGLTGYLSNPEKSKTALMSGGLLGLLNMGLAWAASRSWRTSLSLGLGLAGFLGLVFSWRAVVAFSGLDS